MVGVLTTMALPSMADSSGAKDRDDSPSGLDLRRTLHGHFLLQGPRQRLLEHRVRTTEPWRISALDDASTQLSMLIDADGDAIVDRRVTIDSVQRSLYAEIDNPSSGRVYGYARVWKPRPRVIMIRSPRSVLVGPKSGVYRYYWVSSFHNEGSSSCGTIDDMVFICDDRIPNRGWIEHRSRSRNLSFDPPGDLADEELPCARRVYEDSTVRQRCA